MSQRRAWLTLVVLGMLLGGCRLFPRAPDLTPPPSSEWTDTPPDSLQDQQAEAVRRLEEALRQEAQRRAEEARRQAELAAQHMELPPPPPPPPAPPAAASTVTLERFPTVEAPARVLPGQSFAVLVSLTEDLITPEVEVVQGAVTDAGRIAMDLPDTPEQDRQAWSLDVVLSAPGFAIAQNTASLTLYRHGDSTPARFDLTAEAALPPGSERKLYVTLWHEGTYLAKLERAVTIGEAAAQRAAPAGEAAQPTRDATPLDLTLRQPDLTLFLLEGTDPARPGAVELIVASPHLQPARYTVEQPGDLEAWLQAQYARFAGLSPRGVTVEDAAPPEQAQALLRGFGRTLWERFAPAPAQEAFWALVDRLGPEFDTIQILSNNPRLPWELMRPVRPDGRAERDFLGLDFAIGRWHVAESGGILERPPQAVAVERVVVVAPTYGGQAALPAQVEEVAALAQLPGFQRLDGRFSPVQALLEQLPQGIVHFAGHGEVREAGPGAYEQAILLEDSALDLLTWRGLVRRSGTSHPFFFFNACDVGQVERVASFVAGWAPAVLETGASGYIGALWPLGDRGAAAFARRFYEVLREAPGGRSPTAAEALRLARRLYLDTGDPTHLAYVYYGDPYLTLEIR